MKKKLYSLIALAIIPLCAKSQSYLVPTYYTGNVNSVYVPPNYTQHVLGKTTNASINVVYPSSQANMSGDMLAALDFAMNIWRQTLSSPVTITVEFYVQPLPSTSAGSVVSSGGPIDVTGNFTSTDPKFLANTAYCGPLANKLSSTDQFPTRNDIKIIINSDKVIAGEFYFGTDGNCPSSQLDFVETILHEMGHGVGAMGSSVRIETTPIIYGWSVNNSSLPTSYDRFVIQSSSNILLTSFPFTGSTALTNFVESDDLYWNGPNAIAENSGVKPRLFAPAGFENGSSVTHLDQNNTPELFRPHQAKGESIHALSPVDLGILNDVGWTVYYNIGATDEVDIKGVTYADQPVQILSEGTAYGYTETFDDYIGRTIQSCNWTVTLEDDNGGYVLQNYSQQTHGGNGGDYLSVPTLPSGHNWTRDENGRIVGTLTLVATDNASQTYTKTLQIYMNCKPNVPYITKSSTSIFGPCSTVNISYYAPGATSYVVSNKEITGGLDPWVDNTPVAADNLDFTFTGLSQFNTYQFQVVATNAYGSTASPIITRGRCAYNVNLSPNPVFINIHAQIVPSGDGDSGFNISSSTITNIANPVLTYSNEYDGSSNSISQDVSSLPIGNYIITLFGAKGESASAQFQKID